MSSLIQDKQVQLIKRKLSHSSYSNCNKKVASHDIFDDIWSIKDKIDNINRIDNKSFLFSNL